MVTWRSTVYETGGNMHWRDIAKLKGDEDLENCLVMLTALNIRQMRINPPPIGEIVLQKSIVFWIRRYYETVCPQ